MDFIERIPILGRNPIFVYQAKRTWTRTRAAVILAVWFGVNLSTIAAYYAVEAADRGLSGLAEPLTMLGILVMLPYAGIIGNARYAGNHEPTLLTVLFLGLIIGGAVVGRYIAPALTAPLVARERERRTLQQVAVTPVSPRQVLSGKVWATSLPLAVPFMVLAPCVGLLCGIAGQFNPMETLGYLGFMFAEILVGIYGSLAFSCLCRKTANAVAGGYVLVWTLGPALLIGMMLIAEWHNYYGREAERMVVALAFAVEFAVALAAWLVARATLRRLMAS